jgi:hypothetical protein
MSPRPLTLFISFVLTVVCVLALPARAEILLAENGQPRVAVYVPQAALDAPSYGDIDWHDDDLGPDRSCSEAFLAGELRTYLGRLAGAAPDAVSLAALESLDERALGRTTAVIVAHRSNAADWVDESGFDGPQSYVIKAMPRGEGGGLIVLSGYDIAGTVYSVYEFSSGWAAGGTARMTRLCRSRTVSSGPAARTAANPR